MKLNDDGSVTLYIGPEALFNKTFILNDVELVE